jgi:polyhydroxybutyrate depolymerase
MKSWNGIVAAFGLCMAVSGCANAAAADAPQSVQVAGVERTYVLHVPEQLIGRVPLLISFHGHGGNGASQARLTGLDTLADAYGFIVAYPDGIKRGWNDGRPESANGADDLAFTTALIDDLEKRYPIDAKRVYASGFSNGGTFSNYLACSQADRIAAIAPVSGSMPVVDVAACRPSRAMPFLEIAGTGDPVMPYDGGEITLGGLKRGNVLSVDRTAAFWAKNDGCSRDPHAATLPPVPPADETSITRATFSGCQAGSSVVQYTVTGGGHTWPGGPQYLPKFLIGPASNQLDASEVIVKFLLAHSLP